MELQRKVVRVFYYLCVVTLQYTAPMILILYLTFLYKTLGGGSWVALVSESPDTCEADSCHTQDMEVGIGKMIQQEETVVAITQHFSLAWISIKQVVSELQHFSRLLCRMLSFQVFTVDVFRGLLGFSTWWCCFVWFSSAAIGVGYQSYFYKV